MLFPSLLLLEQNLRCEGAEAFPRPPECGAASRKPLLPPGQVQGDSLALLLRGRQTEGKGFPGPAPGPLIIFKCLLSSYCVECEVLGTESCIPTNFPVTAS